MNGFWVISVSDLQNHLTRSPDQLCMKREHTCTSILPYYDPSKWHKMKAVRSNQGTFPLGSMWTKLEVPVDKTNGWSIKDRVIVPDNLTPGDYILSFRWDSQRTPQIWSNCANIKLVK